MTGLRATVVVAAGRATQMILSLAIGVLSARYFGASPDKDCYLVAKGLPSVLMNILVGGVAPLLLVALARMSAVERPELAGRVLRRAAGRLAIVVGPLVLLLWFGAPRLVALMAPGFGPDQVLLTATLFRLSLLAVLASLVAAGMKSLFNASSDFTLPSIGTAFVGVTALVVLVAGASRVGIPSLALGDLLGQSVAAALLVIVALTSGRLRWRSSPVEAAEAPRAEAFWGPFLVMCLGSNFGSVNTLVNNYFASSLPAGSISTLGFASVLITSGHALFIFSAAEIAFQRLARASGDAARFREDAGRILRSLVLLTLPVVAGTWALARPLIRTVFERGAFDPATTTLVARLFAVLAPDLLIMAFLALFWRVLVARGDYAVVGRVAALSIAANIVLDAVLVRPLGIGGIALATPLVTLVTTLLFWPAVRRACGRIWDRGDVVASLKGGIAAALMGLLVAAWAAGFERVAGTDTEPLRIFQVGLGVLLGGAVYGLLLHALGVKDAADLVRRLTGALRPA